MGDDEQRSVSPLAEKAYALADGADGVDVKTGAGDIRITVPRDIPVWQDLHSSFGEVVSRIASRGEPAEGQPFIRVTARTGTGDVVLQSARSVAVGVMLGIDPAQKDPLTPYLVNVKQTDLEPGKYNVILGEQLASQLGVNRGDQIRVMVPSASQFTPMGRIPSQRLFNVIGTFAANSEVDGYEMLVNIEDASRLMRYPAGNITGWRLWLDEPLKVDSLSQQKLPEGSKWQDWRDRKGELFQAVRMEKNMMGLLLSLIVAVAAFNIITSLGLMVMEKQGEVAILQTQGLTPRQIMMVFMVQGASAGIIGAILGAALGALLASQLNNLMPIIGVLLDGAALPVAIEPLQVIVIALVAMAIALLSTLYPSWRAAATQPAEALRYE